MTLNEMQQTAKVAQDYKALGSTTALWSEVILFACAQTALLYVHSPAFGCEVCGELVRVCDSDFVPACNHVDLLAVPLHVGKCTSASGETAKAVARVL